MKFSMTIFYFFIGTIIRLVKKKLGYTSLPVGEQEITETGMLFIFRLMGVAMLVVAACKIVQRLIS